VCSSDLWLVLPARALKLPGDKHAVGRAFTCPELLQVDGDETTTLLLMPPRYLTHEEAVSRNVRHVIYSSTAVVYGKPRYSPIDEEHPLLVEEARKPLYGITKAASEKLCLMYGKAKGVPATIVRFWWAYGEEIGGKHLREMLKTSSAGEPLLVPADSGGSFLHMADLAQGLDRCLFRPEAYGRTFNFSSVYVTWEEVAEMVRGVTGSRSEIRCVPREEWTGSAFLADPWELSDSLARELLGYRPMEAPAAKASLKVAIGNCWEAMRTKT